jgi:3-oxoacyl-[acyl-carrier protein] reductase
VSERVAIVTGGSGGIGRAVALALAAEGWSVAIGCRSRVAEGREVARTLREKGVSALEGTWDVSSPGECEALVRRVLQEWGRVDALVNAAGAYERVPLLETSPDRWQAMFDVNLHPLFYLGRLVAEPMKACGFGRIVSFGIAGGEQLLGQPNLTAHYVAKVGTLALTRALAKALGPFGVTANCVSPGFIATGGADASELARIQKTIPAGFVGEPRDVAAVVRFLLSEEARYVNGANIVVSGGWGV